MAAASQSRPAPSAACARSVPRASGSAATNRYRLWRCHLRAARAGRHGGGRAWRRAGRPRGRPSRRPALRPGPDDLRPVVGHRVRLRTHRLTRFRLHSARSTQELKNILSIRRTLRCRTSLPKTWRRRSHGRRWRARRVRGAHRRMTGITPIAAGMPAPRIEGQT